MSGTATCRRTQEQERRCRCRSSPVHHRLTYVLAPRAAGVKGTVAYNVGAKDALATVTVDKVVGGKDLSLKASYQTSGNVWVVQETWKVDKDNKLVGT